ncbi:hypothetical protein EGR_08385 [Echinococcus granulosus]|uniref:Uncharacterized protein n=1 Tax=Echinococcus granulosus TaxID=6210 RepID=W6UF15_ECHGR|nr:hypothetical protein EGR_08385 [Echinococcus granulosus]EUB56742.1 hypothetical protein EGR_08385 [Echinococcus granulosus]
MRGVFIQAPPITSDDVEVVKPQEAEMSRKTA